MDRPPAGSAGSCQALSERARAWVHASCAAQGVPVKIGDPRVLRAVAGLLVEAPALAAERRRSVG
jgi:hypothetical protein